VVKAIAAHNSVTSFVATAVEFPAAGFFIALPCSVSCFSTKDRDDARQMLPLEPRRPSIIPERDQRPLLDPDIRVPNHLDAEPFERLWLNCARGGFIQAVDSSGRRASRRVEPVPAFRGITGHARLDGSAEVFVISCARVRAITSVPPPGAKGTTIRMVLSG
jgi:hypothetical protein